jgi:ABC-type polysaccharide/polyol phosphate transport system ATPase subunit
MSQIAIRATNVTKTFRIYDRAVDRLREFASFGKRKLHSNFDALKDVSFEIEKGHFIGIVGRNGAGKSTLLKILSRELTPTSGEVEINGAVSLLQLGAGFDSELTGLENAKFSCQLQGLNEKEIQTALKEIEEFADIGDFFHHPVKTYSSGMHSRLSFACAVYVNPDILIVDEVLSVGDSRFSQKCLRKMHSFKDAGKTIIFVTHNTHQIGVFCDKVIWMRDGRIFEQGPAKEVVENYKNYMNWGKLPGESSLLLTDDDLSDGWISTSNMPQIGGDNIRIAKFRILDESHRPTSLFKSGSQISIQFELHALNDVSMPDYGFLFYDDNGIIALHTNSELAGFNLPSMQKGESVKVTHNILIPLLNRGTYVLNMSAGDSKELDHRLHDLVQIEITCEHLKSRFGYMQIERESAEILL